jgi:UDP-glucose 6-dehydrogenase
VRVLQVGYGAIGREVFRDYRRTLQDHTYMVTDLVKSVPSGYEWDGGDVDLAIVMVDTRPASGGGFDYSDLLGALEEYDDVAAFLLVRSTVGPDLLDLERFRALSHKVGFSPEFNGATPYANRIDTPLGFEAYTANVPEWFRDLTTRGVQVIADAKVLALAKLAENAFLATKVTFFHELILGADALGIDGQEVRRVVTHDPRIGEANSFMVEPGWSSHCYNKDVPAFAEAVDSWLVRAAIETNQRKLRSGPSDRL